MISERFSDRLYMERKAIRYGKRDGMKHVEYDK